MGVLMQGFYFAPGRVAGVPSPLDGDRAIPFWWDHLSAQAHTLATVPGIARAYDATNLDATPIDQFTPRLKILWDSGRAGVNYTHSKFCTPVVADGKLFVPTYDGRVDMYSLKP